MERLCGFCRSNTHKKNKCPQVKAELDAIRIHIPAERKAIHDLLVQNGYGTGAIVNIRGWGEEEYRPAVIPTMNFFHTFSPYRLIDLRKIKYKNRDRIALLSFTARNFIAKELAEAPQNEVAYRYIEHVKIPVYYLHDMSRTGYASILYNKLKIIGQDRPRLEVYYQWEEHAELISPSQDSDTDCSSFIKNVHVSPRLIGANEPDVINGIKSW